jgi:hypothetical protein
MLILNGLSHEIFSALPAISGESERANNHFQADRQRIKGKARENRGENQRGKVSQGKYLRNLFTLSINNHQQPITWQA